MEERERREERREKGEKTVEHAQVLQQSFLRFFEISNCQHKVREEGEEKERGGEGEHVHTNLNPFPGI